VTGVQQIHDCDLVHRDLKLENVLLASPKNQKRARVKVADFGLCAEVGNSNKALGQQGAPFTWPQRSLRERYGKEVDIWSLGVVLYACLAGYLPFGGRHRRLFSALCSAPLPISPKSPGGGVL